MRLWRRHSKFDGLDLLRTCFISHSYKDAAAREQLLALLPKSVKPFVFPPITVAPEQMVSNQLIEAILSCDGLIYINEGASAESFWVAFERDFALRAGKRVYSFTPGQEMLTPDSSPPLELHIFPTWAAADTPRVRAILEFMRDKRFFVPFDLDRLEQTATNDEDGHSYLSVYLQIARNGGLGIFFGSKDAENSYWVLSDASGLAAMEYEPYVADSVIIALLDNSDFPKWFPLKGREVVQLYGDDSRSELQRIDDLIVCLYWLIYRNTHQNQLS